MTTSKKIGVRVGIVMSTIRVTSLWEHHKSYFIFYLFSYRGHTFLPHVPVSITLINFLEFNCHINAHGSQDLNLSYHHQQPEVTASREI